MLDTSRTLNLSKIEQVPLSTDQYFREVYAKYIIGLHHSAGWDNVRNMIHGWNVDKARVGTCVGINDAGTVFQAFSSRYYAWHINVWSKGNRLSEELKALRRSPAWYEKHSIGLEVANWGQLQYRDGKWWTYWKDFGIRGGGIEFKDEKKIITYDDPYQGHRHYERYTDEEMQSVYELCKYWMDYYEIPFSYKGKEHFFAPSKEAISGEPGIYTHTSFRTDKYDMHPQPELIQVLIALS